MLGRKKQKQPEYDEVLGDLQLLQADCRLRSGMMAKAKSGDIDAMWGIIHPSVREAIERRFGANARGILKYVLGAVADSMTKDVALSNLLGVGGPPSKAPVATQPVKDGAKEGEAQVIHPKKQSRGDEGMFA